MHTLVEHLTSCDRKVKISVAAAYFSSWSLCVLLAPVLKVRLSTNRHCAVRRLAVWGCREGVRRRGARGWGGEEKIERGEGQHVKGGGVCLPG